MIDIDLQPEEEVELIIEDQDLRLLKILTSDLQLASEFVNNHDANLFIGDCKRFAETAVRYVKNYRSLPTERVMLDMLSNDAREQLVTQYIWSALSNIEASPSDFRYDLDKLKTRLTDIKIASIKDILEATADQDQQIKQIQFQLEEAKKIKNKKKQSYVQKSLKDYMPEFKQAYNDRFHNKEIGRGILTGYSFFDYIKNGMMPAEMLIIGAESGGGKSFLLNNLAIQMWMQQNTIGTSPGAFTKGYNVLYFSLEMPYEACARRTLACLGDVPMYGIRDCALNKIQMEGLHEVSNFIEAYPNQFEIVDIPRGVTVEQIEARFNEAQLRFQPDIVVVDYLGLLEDSTSDGDDWLKLGYIAGKLHELARAYNIIMLTAVQLNRAATKASKDKDSSELIGMHRIGRSSLIMHHANVGIQIESRKDEQTYSDLRYHIIKNRDGELGSGSLIKNFANGRIKDTDPPYIPTKSDGTTYYGNEVEDISELLAKAKWGR